MLTIKKLEDCGIVLTESEKEKLEAESAQETVTDKRCRYDICDCGKKKKYKNQRCPECATQRNLDLSRERSRNYQQALRDKKASLHECDICLNKHFTIFEYIGLELCNACAVWLAKRERIRLIRMENDTTTNRTDI